MTAGDVLMALTLIEAHARTARDQLASSLLASNTPDGLLMPGQPIPKNSNKQIGAMMMQNHQVSMQRLAQSVNLVFGEQPEAQAPGMNGDADTLNSEQGKLQDQRVSDSTNNGIIGKIGGRFSDNGTAPAH